MHCIIICTIHQPSAEVFLEFDNVLALSRGGQLAYFGDVRHDNCAELIAYFEGIENVQRFPGQGNNVAQWMMSILELERFNTDQQPLNESFSALRSHSHPDNTIDLAQRFCESLPGQKLERLVQSECTESLSTSNLQFIESISYRANIALQLESLIRRSLTSITRSRAALAALVGANTIVALMLGVVFIDTEYDIYAGVTSGVGLVFASVGLVGIIASNSSIARVSDSRALFYREHAIQMYSPLWFVVAETLAEVPVVGISSLLFTLIAFPMAGFWESSAAGASKIVRYWLFLSFHALLQVLTVRVLVLALPTLEVAAIAGALYNSLSFSFMGFNPPERAIPAAYRWLYNSFPARYSCALLLSTVFTSRNSDLGCQQLMGDLPSSVPDDSVVRDVLETMYWVKEGEESRDLVVVVGYLAMLLLLAVLALERINHQRE